MRNFTSDQTRKTSLRTSFTYLTGGKDTKGSGISTESLTGSGFCFTQTAQSTKESSSSGSRRGMEGSFTQMEMCTMGSGRMTELTGMGFSKIPRGRDMKESGKWINSMVEGRKFLRKKDQFMRGTSMKVKNTVKGYSSGLMGVTTKETS